LKVAGFIANRIALNRSAGKRSFSAFIIRLTIVATIISVAVMIITLAFANGFQEKVSQKVFSFWGHVRIQERQAEQSVIAEEIPIHKNDTLLHEISQSPLVRTIHPFATKYGILKTKDEIEGLMIKGLDSTYDFNNFSQFMVAGRPVNFHDSGYYSREIMISAATASQLQLRLNDRVFIYFIRPDGTPRPDKVTICGIYKTGIEEYDKNFAIADIRLIQWLNKWSTDEIGGYEIFLHKSGDMDKAVHDLYELNDFPETWDTKSVRDIAPNIFDWLNMQDVTRNVLIAILIVVAIINLITCLIILVLERIRMIGVLKALGARDWTVQLIFLRQAAFITITGIMIGTALALGFLYLQVRTGFIKLKEDAYYLSEAAVKIRWWEVVTVAGGTLLVCFLVLMIPSLLVRKISPVKAIRFS
jgi:lipoprotein-releasing system permease protein